MEILSNWMNIGGKIGYVVCRTGIENVMRYHYSTEKNRNCDYINLVGELSSDWTRDWACVVTFPNQDQAATESWAKKVVFKVDGNTAWCTIGNQIVSADFSQEQNPNE
jgi:hypothetical protein